MALRREPIRSSASSTPSSSPACCSTAEIAIGTALVLPMVPAWLAGAGLTAFALGTLGLYLRTPGMREEGSLRPTQASPRQDAWMVGIGLALMIDEVAGRAGRS
jgi:hypothetical protein